MKLLIAVPSEGRPRKVFSHTVRWLARTGFDYAVFVPERDVAKYRRRISDANYRHYLAIEPAKVVEVSETVKDQDTAIKKWAWAQGYRILFVLPDNIHRWAEGAKNVTDDEAIVKFHGLIMNTRMEVEKRETNDDVVVFDLRKEFAEAS